MHTDVEEACELRVCWGILNVFIVPAYMFVHVLSEQQAHAWVRLQVSGWQAF